MPIVCATISCAMIDSPNEQNPGSYQNQTHLLISEILYFERGSGTLNDEFIEIYNPTSQTISLTNYYLSDHPEKYYQLTDGQKHITTRFDWIARFPQGAIIGPQERRVICNNALTTGPFGAGSYAGKCNYAMVSTSNTLNLPVMSAIDTGQTTTLTLSDSGETLLLFYWDGQSDLVQDVDIVFFDESYSSTAPSKTGLSFDGLDGDSAPTAYLDDYLTYTSIDGIATTIGKSVQRTSFDENEFIPATSSGQRQFTPKGNGISGHDETRENSKANFSSNNQPTPGT